jgi:hypothetical protein
VEHGGKVFCKASCLSVFLEAEAARAARLQVSVSVCMLHTCRKAGHPIPAGPLSLASTSLQKIAIYTHRKRTNAPLPKLLCAQGHAHL